MREFEFWVFFIIGRNGFEGKTSWVTNWHLDQGHRIHSTCGVGDIEIWVQFSLKINLKHFFHKLGFILKILFTLWADTSWMLLRHRPIHTWSNGTSYNSVLWLVSFHLFNPTLSWIAHETLQHNKICLYHVHVIQLGNKNETTAWGPSVVVQNDRIAVLCLQVGHKGHTLYVKNPSTTLLFLLLWLGGFIKHSVQMEVDSNRPLHVQHFNDRQMENIPIA